MELAEAVWPDVAAAPRGLLVLPVGSLEQHGPHLPLDTDARIAAAVAAAIPPRRRGAGLAPTLAYGASGEHAGFPGTLSIGAAALQHVIVELVRDAARDWPGVLVVNGHGGNVAALTAAAILCAREGRTLATHHLSIPGGDAHAGRSETSLMLHLAPALVRLDAAAPGDPRPLSQILPTMVRDGVRAVSGNGVLGDPTGAGSAEGRRWFATLCAGALEVYDATLAACGETA